MKRVWRTALLLAAAALAGCGGLGEERLPTAPGAGPVAQTTEEGGKFIGFVGPREQFAEPFLGVPATNYSLLRSWIDTRTGEVAHQLYVENSYFGAAREWNSAEGPGGTLRVIPISKNEIVCEPGCSYAEEFAAVLPDALLRANPQGLAVTFTGKTGARQLIMVPGDAIRKQLAAVDAARAALPTAPASAAAVAPAQAPPSWRLRPR